MSSIVTTGLGDADEDDGVERERASGMEGEGSKEQQRSSVDDHNRALRFYGQQEAVKIISSMSVEPNSADHGEVHK